MASKIRVLDDHTINKIAAGEVIENPSSVVKELVENSIDAGALEIIIEIKGGGRQLIRVTDNGDGMNGDDAVLCFERHATSKLRALDDLNTLGTMGFRGEALPSIASISKLTLLTCQKGQEKGTLVMIDGGKMHQAAPAPRAAGTTFEVKELFFNVPVRKKFQRSPDYDTQEILKMATSLALAHPQIKFRLISNEKELLKAEPSGLKERISAVLGREFSTGLCPLALEKGEISLSGFIGQPAFTRHNRTGQFLFINERGVFSPMISHAVKEAYGTTLSPNRHPVFVLHLKIPGGFVDVNVHPQKREVRLRNSPALHEAIKAAVESSLGQDAFEEPQGSFVFQAPPTFSMPAPFLYTPAPLPPKIFKEETLPLFESPKVAPLPKVIATLPGYFLLSTESGSLKAVDQRAAHARVLFEQLSAKETVPSPAQQLLIPITIETTPAQAEALREHLDKLKAWGLGIEEFGPKSFRVDAVPRLWEKWGLEALILDIIEGLKDQKVEIDKKLAATASRAAFSSAKKLGPDEAFLLISQLYRCKQPNVCPLGKKTMIDLELEPLFNL